MNFFDNYKSARYYWKFVNLSLVSEYRAKYKFIFSPNKFAF